MCKVLLISWNIQKHKNWSKVDGGTRILLDILLKEDPDVLFLQESMKEPLEEYLKALENYDFFFSSTRNVRGRGLMGNALIWKRQHILKHSEEWKISVSAMESRKIQLIDLQIDQKSWRFVNVHLGLHSTWRSKQWDFLKKKTFQDEMSMIIGGDFNASKKERDGWIQEHFCERFADCGNTFPSIRPTRALDSFLLRKMSESWSCGHFLTPYSISSDHLPVWISIQK